MCNAFLVLALQASLLVRHSPSFVSNAFCHSRLGQTGQHNYGTPPVAWTWQQSLNGYTQRRLLIARLPYCPTCQHYPDRLINHPTEICNLKLGIGTASQLHFAAHTRTPLLFKNPNN